MTTANSNKSKPKDPTSITEIINDTDKLIEYYHSEIERIFETFNLDDFGDKLKSSLIDDELNEIKRNFVGIDKKSLVKLKGFIYRKFLSKTKHATYQKLREYLLALIDVQNLFKNLKSKFNDTLQNGLLRYCISYSEFCVTNIEFIFNYEKIIRKNRPDITSLIYDLLNEKNKFTSQTNDSIYAINNVPEIVSSIKLMRASINRLYYLITEWTDEERDFTENLSSELKSTKSELHDLNSRMKDDDNLLTYNKTKLANLERGYQTNYKNHLSLKRKLSRVKKSIEFTTNKKSQLSSLSTSCSDELLTSRKRLKKLEYLNKRPSKRKRIPNYKFNMELNAAKIEQREKKAKQYKTVDDIDALTRHLSRLHTLESQINDKLIEVDDKLVKITKQQNRLRKEIAVMSDDNKIKTDELKDVIIKYKDLSIINEKKHSFDTFRQLKKHGKIQKENKKTPSLLDVGCDLVINGIQHEDGDVGQMDPWQRLYLCLPIQPNRSREQRLHDIDVLDRYCVRHDYPPMQQTKAALDKWRLFFHMATIDDLLEGLKKVKFYKLSNKIEELIMNVTARYNDDEDDEDEVDAKIENKSSNDNNQEDESKSQEGNLSKRSNHNKEDNPD